jgi:hypothetical protein
MMGVEERMLGLFLGCYLLSLVNDIIAGIISADHTIGLAGSGNELSHGLSALLVSLSLIDSMKRSWSVQ